MSAFSRQQKRFLVNGLSLAAAKDTQVQGKWPVLVNVRSYQQGTLQARAGLTPIPGNAALGAAVHSLYRLSDTTPFASIPARFVLGSGGNLNTGPAGGPFPGADAGYSGSPLSMLAIQPTTSPQPWLYVADSARMRKLNVNGLVYPIGIAAPTVEPSVELYTIGINLVASFHGGLTGWSSVGTTSALATGNRVNTTIAFILYDTDPVLLGWSCMVPTSFANIGENMMLVANGVDQVQVSQLTVAVADTTIAAIIYDVGASGLCTIQPAASLGTGQLDMPPSKQIPIPPGVGRPIPPGAEIVGIAVPRGLAKLPNANVIADSIAQDAHPDPLRTKRARQTDFPVNSLVRLNATENVRILSVATGPDGIQSFRCKTVGTFAAGQTLTGIAAMRVWGGPYAAGQTLVANTIKNTLTPTVAPPATTANATGGAMSAVLLTPLALIRVGGADRPTQPEDDIHLAVKISDLTVVKAVRIYLDVDGAVNDFTQNYYFFEWRAADIIESIQATNAANVNPVQLALQTTATNATATTTATTVVPPAVHRGIPTNTPPAPQTIELGIGNAQWLDLRCKVGQLIHAGTDFSKTLANVTRTEVLVSMEGANPIDIEYDTLYASGGFGADVGEVNDPFKYRFSFRSTKTGARSNPSPETPGGTLAKRQRVILTASASADPQADLIDWWRFGGTLTHWTYLGTSKITGFNDDYSDAGIDGGQTLEFDNFQPWPSLDLPRTGTCNVAGNALRWVSGDHFNTAWAEGSAIIVNGRTYTLQRQPSSTTLIMLHENAGSGVAVDFTVIGATLVSQNYPILFGGPIGGTIFTFGLGDPNNPGSLYWTKGNSPDMASDRSSLAITAPSEPLLGGCLYDGLPYVFSSDELYVVEPDFNNPQQFRALITPCHRGLWTRWAVCPTSIGIAFLSKDGIYVSRNGSPAVSLTDQDLYNLFPHDGVPGVTVNGYHPPDMSQPTKLRLTWADDYLYFDYVDTSAESHTLVYRISDKSWWGDTYTPGITARFWETGLQVHQELIGGADGNTFTPSGITDNGTPFSCQAQIVENQNDARAQKLYRDVMLEMEGGGATVTMGMALTNGTVAYPTASFVTVGGRKPYYATLDPTGMAAYGVNLTLTFGFPSVSLSGPSPILYLYDIGFQLEPELSVNWLSGPTTHMLPGYQQVPLALLAYISSGPVTFNVIVDGVLYTYALPSTGGVYLKKFFRLQAVKGLTFQYGFQASAQAAFMLFDRDCEVWVQPWGYGGSYQKTKPFSGGQIGVGAQGNVRGDG